MDFLLEIILIAVLLAECLVGLIVNLFIVVVYLIKWKAVKSVDTCEKILIWLGTSRSSCLLFCLTVYPLLHFTSLPRFHAFLSVVIVVGMFLHLENLCITAILCVFYCVKITNYSQRFFTFLKPRISRLVPWLLMASLLISLLCSLPAGWYTLKVKLEDATINNITAQHVFIRNGINQLALFLLQSAFPFIILCVAVSLLVGSLWMHSIQMRNNGASFRSPDLEVLFSAVKTMVIFLFLQLLYFVCSCVLMSELISRDNPWRVFLSIVVNFSPAFHSAFIIASNSKLKEKCLEMWRGLTKCAEPSKI